MVGCQHVSVGCAAICLGGEKDGKNEQALAVHRQLFLDPGSGVPDCSLKPDRRLAHSIDFAANRG
jgi:hypothetical protein